MADIQITFTDSYKLFKPSIQSLYNSTIKLPAALRSKHLTFSPNWYLAWSTLNKPSKSYIAFCSYALVCYTTATRPGAAGCSPLLSVAVSTASGDSGGGALSSAALQVMLVPRMIVEQLSNIHSVSATALRSYKHHLILPGNRYGWRVCGYQALMGAQLRLLTLRTTRRG